jgi:hypothetical protein
MQNGIMVAVHDLFFHVISYPVVDDPIDFVGNIMYHQEFDLVYGWLIDRK